MSKDDHNSDLSEQLILLSKSGDQTAVNMSEVKSVEWFFSQSVTLNYFDGRSISFSSEDQAVDQLLEYFADSNLTRMMKYSEGKGFRLLHEPSVPLPF